MSFYLFKKRFERPKSSRLSRFYSDGDVLRSQTQNQTNDPNLPTAVKDVIHSEGEALDSGTRTRMESHFGQDFSHVRVHTDSKAAVSSAAVDARAYTVGNHVVFGASEYRPGTLIGDALLAHELAHVVQQSETRDAVGPADVGGSRPDALEAEADVSVIGVLGSICDGAKCGLVNMRRNVKPQLRSGLRLSRCKPSADQAKELAKECATATKPKIVMLDRTHPKTQLIAAGCAPGIMEGKVEFYHQGMLFAFLPIAGGMFGGPIGSVFNTSTPGACKTVEAKIYNSEGNNVATLKETVTDKKLFPHCK